MSTMRGVTRARPVAVAAALAAAGLAGCGGQSETTGSTEILEVHARDASTLEVYSPSCNGDPRVEVTETDTTVELHLTATVRDRGDACLDIVVVDLQGPLEDRTVADIVAESALEVVQDGP